MWQQFSVSPDKSLTKWLLSGLWLLIFLLAAIYYPERSCFVDNALQLHEMVTTHDFYFNGHRWITAVPQIPVLVLILFGASLKALAIVYSLSFAAFPAVFSVLAYKKLKDPLTAFLIAACYIGLNHHVFFIPASQITLGITLCLFTTAWWRKGIEGKWSYFVFFVLFLLQITAHPLMLIITFFLLVFTALEEGRNAWKRYIMLLAVFFMLVVLFYVVLRTGYDSRSMGKMKFQMLLEPYLTLNLDYVVHHWIWRHIPLLVITVFAFLMAFVQKERVLSAVFTLCCAIGAFLLLYITFHQLDPPHYLEIQLFPVPLMLLYFTAHRLKKFQISILMLVSVIGVAFVWHLGKPYQQRTDRLLRFTGQLTSSTDTTYHYRPHPVDKERFVMTWAFSHESSLLSRIFQDKSVTIYTLKNVMEHRRTIKATLHGDYIPIHEHWSSLASCQQVERTPDVQIAITDRGEYSVYGPHFVSVKITNLSDEILCASSTAIGYKLYQANGQLLNVRQYRQNHLDKDIEPGASYAQDILVEGYEHNPDSLKVFLTVGHKKKKFSTTL